MRLSGPRRESAVEVVNSFMFEASGRCVPAALAQRTSPPSFTTSRPLAEPPPRVSQPRIWSHAWLARAPLAPSRSAITQVTASMVAARLITSTNMRPAQSSD